MNQNSYQTRRLLALRDLRHDGQNVNAGGEVFATDIDARYLIRAGAASDPVAAPPKTPTAAPIATPRGRPGRQAKTETAPRAPTDTALMTSADTGLTGTVPAGGVTAATEPPKPDTGADEGTGVGDMSESGTDKAD